MSGKPFHSTWLVCQIYEELEGQNNISKGVLDISQVRLARLGRLLAEIKS